MHVRELKGWSDNQMERKGRVYRRDAIHTLHNTNSSTKPTLACVRLVTIGASCVCPLSSFFDVSMSLPIVSPPPFTFFMTR